MLANLERLAREYKEEGYREVASSISRIANVARMIEIANIKKRIKTRKDLLSLASSMRESLREDPPRINY